MNNRVAIAMRNAWQASKLNLDICDYIIKSRYVVAIFLHSNDEMRDVD